VSEPRRFAVISDGVRADHFLAEQLPGASRKTLAAAFAEGRVRAAGRRLKKGDRLLRGQELELVGELVDAQRVAPVSQPELPLELLHVDDALLAVAKPVGLATHPLVAGELGTLASAVVARHPECASASVWAREGGAAHRLDTGTSGVVLFARTRAAYLALRASFAAHAVHKTYLALVVGTVTRDGELDAAIATRGDVAVVDDDDPEAQPARTSWRPLERLGAVTLVECATDTGRLHQVRVHLAHAGHPIVGDRRYGIGGVDLPSVTGHFLHASAITLPHPVTGAPFTISAPLPADREALLASLRRA
jgi:23S rRNA pseudouridine1911/1915/1917 synthase